jgi:hypothetical protein
MPPGVAQFIYLVSHFPEDTALLQHSPRMASLRHHRRRCSLLGGHDGGGEWNSLPSFLPRGECPFSTGQSLPATVGTRADLLGYWISADQVKAGESLRMVLFSRACSDMELDYSVFTHLLDPDGYLHSQQDSYPQGGNHPTSRWTLGDIVLDSYVLRVGPDVPAGAYQIEVGMYDWRTGQRLPALNRLGQRIS